MPGTAFGGGSIPRPRRCRRSQRCAGIVARVPGAAGPAGYGPTFTATWAPNGSEAQGTGSVEPCLMVFIPIWRRRPASDGRGHLQPGGMDLRPPPPVPRLAPGRSKRRPRHAGSGGRRNHHVSSSACRGSNPDIFLVGTPRTWPPGDMRPIGHDEATPPLAPPGWPGEDHRSVRATSTSRRDGSRWRRRDARPGSVLPARWRRRGPQPRTRGSRLRLG
jgi:hypothetical protein